MKSSLLASLLSRPPRFLRGLFCLWLSLAAAFGAEHIAPAGSLGSPRKDHTATVLADGRVLIVGGENASGELASAEIFDPAQRTFVPAGTLLSPRVRHAATRLADGRVLITGGRNASGVLATAEIFDPAAVAFRPLTAAMGVARQQHTATLLASGKVLVAGGDVAGTGEIFDPATETFSSSLLAMVESRAGHAVSRLPENNLLLAGGGRRSVEVFDLQTSAFLSWTAVLQEARTRPSAIPAADGSIYFVGGEPSGTLEKFDLLAGSGASLPLGGVSSGAVALANGKVLVTGPNLATLFTPSTGALTPVANATALQRSGQTLTELPANKQILVVGGVDAASAYIGAAALYNPARIETDKADYYPDEPVTVLGYGWKPGENVDLYVVDSLGWVFDSTVTANAAGEFVADPYFVVLWRHLGVTFDLTAIGEQSGLEAKHSFTDSPKVGTVTVGAQSHAVYSGSAGNTTFLVTVNRDGTGSTINAAMSLTFPGGAPAGVTGTFNPTTVVLLGNPRENQKSTTLTFTTSAITPAGSYGFTVRAADGVDDGTGTGTLVIGEKVTPTITWSNPADITYETLLSATQLNATATYNGNSVPGTFVYSPAAGTKLNAGSNQNLSVTFTPDDTTAYNSASRTVQINVLKATPTATLAVSNTPQTYSGSAQSATVSISNSSVPGSVTNILTGGAAAQTNAGTYAVTANFVPTDTNYNTLTGLAAGNFVINKANATVNVTGYTGTYDGAAHGATGTATGVGGVDLSGSLNLGATFTNAPGGTANWTFSGGTNYNDQSGSVAITINKADATVTVTGYTGTYDGLAHGASGTATGVGGANLNAQFNLGATFTDAPGGTANWTFSGGTNYRDQSGSVAITINKANATVTVIGYTGTYDGLAHGASGTATGVGGANLNAQLNLGATFTDVPGGTANWSFNGGVNYHDQSGSVAIVINKANANVTVNGYTGVYDAQPHGASGTATGVGGVNLASGLNLGATFTDVPGGTANWTFTGGTNYNDQSGSVAIVINKANANVTVNGYTGVYDGQPHGASGTATGVGGVNLAGGLNLGATFTNVPGGTAHWTFTGGTNYNDQSGSVAIVINKANATVSVSGYTGVYDAQPHGASGTATGVGGVNLSSGLNLGATFTDVPGGTANWTFTGGTNYNDQSGSVLIVINKANATVSVTGYTGTYDGQPHGATGTATGVGGVDLSGSLNLGASYTNVPGGTANWNFVGGTNYNNQSGSVEIVINKATPTATLTVANSPKTYNGAGQFATVAVSNNSVPGSAANVLTGGAATQTNAGNYAVTADFVPDDTTNYHSLIGLSAGTFVINKANATVVVSGYTGVYDGQPHGATGTATGVNGVNLAGGLNLGATFTNVPGGTANWTFTGGTNYHDQSGSVLIVINKANATVSVSGYTGVYDAQPHGATGTATGVNGVNLAGGLTLGATFTNAPGGTAHWTFSGGTNYNDESGSVAIVINKADATVTVAGYSGTFDGQAHGATGTATGVGGVDLSSGLTLGSKFTFVPGGTALWTFSGGTNYNNQSGGVAIVIAPADIAPTITAPLSGLLIPVGQNITAEGTFNTTGRPAAPGSDGSYKVAWTFTSADTTVAVPLASYQPAAVGTKAFSTAGISFTRAGVYQVSLTVTDAAGVASAPVNVVTPSGLPAFIVVYDPSGGFVTGGGWIDSPAGAYMKDPTLVGKANFGFVSKYQKGANVPTGNTEFQFKAGYLHFQSSSYEWLVVAGARGQFKGVGTINGEAGYGFLLTAIDGQLGGGGGTDKFRIKIWNRTTGESVYDNQPGASDDATPTTALGGGSIVIHDAKK